MNFSQMTNEELKKKIKFGEAMGGQTGMYVVREASIELNKRAF